MEQVNVCGNCASYSEQDEGAHCGADGSTADADDVRDMLGCSDYARGNDYQPKTFKVRGNPDLVTVIRALGGR